MSRSLIDYQRSPTRQLVRTIREATRHQAQERSLQLQGNEALQLYVTQGFFEIFIPTTPSTHAASFPIVAPNEGVILLANLMYSVYYPYEVGWEASPTGWVYDQRDTGDVYPNRLSLECFLSYDDRPTGSGSLLSQADVLGTSVSDHAVRLTARVRSNSSWSLPPGASNRLWIYYQIRATLAGGTP
jgi:hypothetical protein